MTTLWGGRFAQKLDQLAWELNTSLPVDKRMAIQDVEAPQLMQGAVGAPGRMRFTVPVFFRIKSMLPFRLGWLPFGKNSLRGDSRLLLPMRTFTPRSNVASPS